MAKMFGLPGLDDAFQSRLRGQADQICRLAIGDLSRQRRVRRRLSFRGPRDAGFPVPGAARQRSHHSVRRASGAARTDLCWLPRPHLPAAPGPWARAAAGAGDMGKATRVSRAEGRFTVITDGEILTNNSEDGAAPHPLGRAVALGRVPARPKSPRLSSACSADGPLVERAVAYSLAACHGPALSNRGNSMRRSILAALACRLRFVALRRADAQGPVARSAEHAAISSSSRPPGSMATNICGRCPTDAWRSANRSSCAA